MKIAWATPLNRMSSIACDFGLPVIREMIRQGHHVEIIRTEIGKATRYPALPIEAPIHVATVFADRFPINFFDAVIVNWGDNLLFHGGALALVARVPTIAIFHDVDMRGFVAAATKLYRSSRANFTVPLPAGYRSDELQNDSVEALAWFATLASAVIVHDKQCLRLVRAACPGSVRLISPEISASHGPNTDTDFERLTSSPITTDFPSNFVKLYVDAALPVVREAIMARPVLDLGLQLGAIFDACGASYDEPAISRIGSVVDELFGRKSELGGGSM